MSKPTKQELIDHVESLVAKCAELTSERDEARREVCDLKSFNYDNTITSNSYADLRKWDCFNTPEAKVDKTLNGVIVDGGKAVPPNYENLEDV